MRSKCFYLLCLGWLWPMLGWAHPGHLPAQGFMVGLQHPFSGWDHMLAMLAIGMIAAQKRSFWTWGLPCLFLGFMIVGGVLGSLQFNLPWAELGITLSVLTLGLCVSFPHALPGIILGVLTGVFAICHGHSHGTEMMAGLTAWQYGAGFVVATGILHLLGVGLGYLVVRKQAWILQLSGFSMAAATIWL